MWKGLLALSGHSGRVGRPMGLRATAGRSWSPARSSCTGPARRRKDTWHRLGTARLSSHGYFHRSYRPAFGGDIAFRAVKAAVGSHHRAWAVSEATEVFEWQSLWRYNLGAADGT